MTQAAGMLRLLSKSVVSVSTKLSIAAVLGLAGLSLLPHDAVSRMSAATRAAPIEVVPTKPVLLADDAPGEPAIQLAARRSRPRPEPAPAGASEPSSAHKNSAIAPGPERREAGEKDKRSGSAPTPEPTKMPPPAPDGKSEAAQAEPPKPEVWSDAEMIAGLRECVRLLAPIAAEVEISQPVKQDVCGT